MNILLLIFLLLIIIIGCLVYNHKDNFVNARELLFNTNKFKQVTFPELDNYDIEIAIPSGQILHNTVQGNWAISSDANNEGISFGVYRDGYSADGSIFKGITGKRYKRMLEQGPYTIRYKNRKNKIGNYDVKIFIDDELVITAENEGTNSKKLKNIGTNYNDFNKETKTTDRGRRKLDYIKFIPKQNEKEGFSLIEGMEDKTSLRKKELESIFAAYFLKQAEINKNCFDKHRLGQYTEMINQYIDNKMLESEFKDDWKTDSGEFSEAAYEHAKKIALDLPNCNELFQNNSEELCPKNCTQTTKLTGLCSSDIIQQETNEGIKYYRSCGQKCLGPRDPLYVNYDKSSDSIPYNPIRDGCRYDNQCSKCPSSLVLVDISGRDQYYSPFETSDAPNEEVKKMLDEFPESRSLMTNNQFGDNNNASKISLTNDERNLLSMNEDNRLGGSDEYHKSRKGAFRQDYKPENPREGVHHFDSIWKFK